MKLDADLLAAAIGCQRSRAALFAGPLDVACDYWEMRKCNEAADAGNFELVTRLVNGGTNGLVDRLNRWERAKRVLGVRETTNEQA